MKGMIQLGKILLPVVLVGLLAGGRVQAGTIYDSPYVSFSPDGKAWTTNAGDTNVVWYKADGSDDVKVHGKRELADCGVGEHYYAYIRQGIIPVSEWRVSLSRVNCCHNNYTTDTRYHGVEFVKQPCGKEHFSAWYPVCADCGMPITKIHFYMSKAAAKSLDYLELGKECYYYYLCPFNRNLEQGTDLKSHECRKVSKNQYRVVYHPNAGEEAYTGYMAPSFHMYSNAVEYEGKQVTPQTHLSPNQYARIGWEFCGWNTLQDGTGQFLKDEEEILNLCEKDYRQDETEGTVILYAMWRKSRGILEIDSGEDGGYMGYWNSIVEIPGEYGSSVYIDPEDVLTSMGCWVSFDACGGNEVKSIREQRCFAGWRQEEPFEGKMQGNYYYFLGRDGNRDRITAVYEPYKIILPKAYRDNYSFDGWYYDKEYQKKAGNANDEFMPSAEITLYAKWVELYLESYADPLTFVEGGMGAANLKWSQLDGHEKTYKIFQCLAGGDWKQLYTADGWWRENGVANVQEEFDYCGYAQYFTVPISGFYQIEVYGSQGEGNEECAGGKGGMAKGSFWLEQGEKLEICVGGQETVYGGGDRGEAPCGMRGGDYSAVFAGNTLLVMAGGGGGAGPGGDGGAGGENSGLVETGFVGGEGGSAGGGGGYLGGRSGKVEFHYHEPGVCNHVHEGSSSEKGGCYTKEMKCGNTLIHKHTRTEYWSWGGSDESYCPNCGADASKGESCSGHSTKYYSHTCPVHGKQASNTSADKPAKCTKLLGYEATCGRTEEYTCGYEYDGAVARADSSYGGSSYVNSEYARSYATTAGVQQGLGHIIIRSEDVGYWNEMYLGGVPVPDKAAPKAIDTEKVTKEPIGSESILVQWEHPQDLGTVYYHKVESYLHGDSQKMLTSNVTCDTIVTGIMEYWYVVDEFADTQVTEENGKSMGCTGSKGEIEITLCEKVQFLHIVARDYSYNCSATVHICLGNLTGGSEGVKWPLRTRKLKIEDTDSVYFDILTDTYYVKADNNTPFVVEYEAYMEGIATAVSQINYAVLECGEPLGNRTRNIARVPSGSVAEDTFYDARDIRISADKEGFLKNGNYIVAERKNNGNTLTMSRAFLLSDSANGQKMELIPIAGTAEEGKVRYSEYEKDVNNGIRIVGDSEAPEIMGMEVLEKLSLLDRREQEIHLCITAYDALSGVKEFYIEIENLDNGAIQKYYPGEDGAAEVDICSDEAIFSGDFQISVYAKDRVGNDKRITCKTTEFDLQVSIERILEPHTPVFKRGESGILHICAWGYVDRIEVIFPGEISPEKTETVYTYEYPLKGDYMQQEQLVFTIPLDVEKDSCHTVTVRAYKGDKLLEKNPALSVLEVSGSILDNLRTRLR